MAIGAVGGAMPISASRVCTSGKGEGPRTLYSDSKTCRQFAGDQLRDLALLCAIHSAAPAAHHARLGSGTRAPLMLYTPENACITQRVTGVVGKIGRRDPAIADVLESRDALTRV